MLRYDLDKLGWYEFEGLVAALLKAKLGYGVEAWGGNKDDGRDAYYEGELRYPGRRLRKGPFLFQCKFVDSANAAGAKTGPAVLGAVRAECKKLKDKQWSKRPSTYSLFTNAKVSPTTRDEIKKLIKKVLPRAEVVTHGGTDVCAWLDNAPEVARAFPQLLGLRNLRDLLKERVNADILARSAAAIDEAKELARVFVPTRTYYEALSKVQQHRFVVLEGLPEMGKTAIGRVIALAKMNEGWSAFECREPDEFLRAYSFEEKQVFLADDFFGRNEYVTGRVGRWQDELAGIFRRLDATHWLIFTSRAHLLRIAEQTLDVSGLNEKFPRLSDVVVDASHLSREEKARILYRHAKDAELDPALKELVRKQAEAIVGNEYYTPERIKRLVRTWLPDELGSAPNTGDENDVAEAIQQNLKSPTKGMEVTFASLPASYKWLLFAAVELEHAGSARPEELRAHYESLCPPRDLQPFERVTEQLSEAFLSISRNYTGVRFKWSHPSVIDMLIEELSASGGLRQHFLSHCGAHGLGLATSVGGGARGTRVMPLLITDKDWNICLGRAKALLPEAPDVLTILLNNYTVLVKREGNENGGPHESKRQKFEQLIILDLISEASLLAGQQKIEWSIPSLQSYYRARRLAPGYLPTVDPRALFDKTLEATISRLSSRELSNWVCQDFGDLLSLLDRNDPSFLRRGDVRKLVEPLLDELLSMGEERRFRDFDDYVNDYINVDELESEQSDLEALSKVYAGIARLTLLPEETAESFQELADKFEGTASHIESSLDDMRRQGAESRDDYTGLVRKGGFSIEQLFADL